MKPENRLMTDTITVRDVALVDYPIWLTMWKDYCAPWVPTEEVTNLLWKRLTEESQIGLPEGIVAVDSQNQVIGFCHYLRHAHTWGVGWWCYCEDLYVVPEARNSKIGRALLQLLLDRGRGWGWDSI